MEKNNENQTSAVEINLQELLLLYLRRWWAIAICCVLGAALMLTYTKMFVTPLYQAHFSVYINNKGEVQGDYLSSSDLSASSWLVNGYMEIVREDQVVSAASDVLDNQYSVGQIKGMVSARKVESTQIFKVYVTHPVPVEAARIANAIAQVLPVEGPQIIEGSSAKIIGTAKVPSSRVSPSYTKSVVVGGLVGALVMVLFLTIRFLRDTRIRDEEELLMLFDLPVLGRIPDFEQEGVTSTYEYVKKPAAKEEAK